MASTIIINYNNIITEFTRYYIINDLIIIFQQNQKGILRYKEKIYILYQEIDNIIKNYYDNLLQEYLDIIKTIEFIRKYYIFFKFKK